MYEVLALSILIFEGEAVENQGNVVNREDRLWLLVFYPA